MTTDPLPIYVVTAYRWGQRNAHSYVVKAFNDLEQAKTCATDHVEYRGGKYACEVIEADYLHEGEKVPRQVFYVESPYYGMAGDAGHFHPADVNKKPAGCRAPVTVRELQNRIGELEREAMVKADFWRKEYADCDREKLLSLAIMRSVCREADMAKVEEMQRTLGELRTQLAAMRAGPLTDAAMKAAEGEDA